MRTVFVIYLVVMVISAVLSAWLWPYSINAWLVYSGKEPSVLWWHGVLLGLVPGVSQACLPAAIFTWLLMLFLV